jgi:hypothetical protein
MAVSFVTTDPSGLLRAIKDQIDKKKIETWSYDSAGDFTHAPEQWKRKAWLRPSVQNGALVFNIVSRNDETLTKVVYGIYHGRFIEMMLTHFDGSFSQGMATALPIGRDLITTAVSRTG